MLQRHDCIVIGALCNLLFHHRVLFDTFFPITRLQWFFLYSQIYFVHAEVMEYFTKIFVPPSIYIKIILLFPFLYFFFCFIQNAFFHWKLISAVERQALWKKLLCCKKTWIKCLSHVKRPVRNTTENAFLLRK